ncbi:hypothetical protein HOY80DRAFT_1140058 [Tuber brumale]|nr:hypothetical protein HOY80DRAFT_1140058 [Tuber brumale]
MDTIIRGTAGEVVPEVLIGAWVTRVVAVMTMAVPKRESTFSTAGFGNWPWVTRKASEEFHSDCVVKIFESGQETKMVWGAFCRTTRSKLVFIPSKVKVDSTFYVNNIMHPHLVPLWYQCCEKYDWVTVIEDGAPGHKDYSIQYRNLNVLEATKWPAQSPDLNLIEALWLDMENELGETWGRIGDIKTLERALSMVWNAIPNQRLESLIRTMPEHLQAAIDADGGVTRY